MFTTLRKAWKITPLRNRILYTLLMILIFRLGANIPLPGIDGQALSLAMANTASEGVLGIFNLMSGDAFKRFSLFALGITPYITASIILNLLTVAIPYLERLAKQGLDGRKKIAQYTRYGTVIIALIQAYGFSYGIFLPYFKNPGFLSVTYAAIILTAGTAFLMYLGEHITEKGIGNGISLFIFSGIIARLPSGTIDLIMRVRDGEVNIISAILFVIVALFMVAGVIMITQGMRKIPVQHAKRVVGRKMYGGQSTHIPLRVNQAGVIPVIFATSILAIPSMIAGFMAADAGFRIWVGKWFASSSWLFMIIQFLLIIFFAYFYTSITFNPYEIAENLKKNGGFVPGIRPGKPTVEYIQRSVNRLILIGATCLGIIAVLPNIMMNFTPIRAAFGGTSLIIVVGVALETTRQIEAQMLMRNYKGFL